MKSCRHVRDMSKVVAPSIHNSKFQELKEGDLAVLFFRESCPYCKDFKPTWNRVAKTVKERWSRGDSVVYDGDEDDDSSRSVEERSVELVRPPVIAKLDVTKFPAVKNRIRFPTVPCVALYKKGERVVFYTGKDRSLPHIVDVLENYYKRAKLPAADEYVLGTEHGSYPAPPRVQLLDEEEEDQSVESKSVESSSKTPVAKAATPAVQNKQPLLLTFKVPPVAVAASVTPVGSPAALNVQTTRAARSAMSYNKSTPALGVQRGPSLTSAKAHAAVSDEDVFARFLALLYERRGELK